MKFQRSSTAESPCLSSKINRKITPAAFSDPTAFTSMIQDTVGCQDSEGRDNAHPTPASVGTAHVLSQVPGDILTPPNNLITETLRDVNEHNIGVGYNTSFDLSLVDTRL